VAWTDSEEEGEEGQAARSALAALRSKYAAAPGHSKSAGPTKKRPPIDARKSLKEKIRKMKANNMSRKMHSRRW